jgi:hypothetical protein
MKKIIIDTPSGIGTIEELGVSDLGFLMIRINIEKDGESKWVTYNLGIHSTKENMFTNAIRESRSNGETKFVPLEWDYSGWVNHVKENTDSPWHQENWNRTLMTMINRLVIFSDPSLDKVLEVSNNLYGIFLALEFFNITNSVYGENLKVSFVQNSTNTIRLTTPTNEVLGELIVINYGPIS